MNEVNLVDDIFLKRYDFEASIFCTYGLNLNFLENYLMKLDALASCDNICIFTDSSTYDSFINESYTPRWLNRKYLVNRIRTRGVFHPKLYMLASEKKAIIGIGSANLTREGIASNMELLSTFEVSEKDNYYAPLLKDCIDYISRIAHVTKSKKAIDMVEIFKQVSSTYLNSISTNDIHFIHNLDRPIIEYIKEYSGDQHIKKIQIISPFFDTKLTPLKSLREAFPSCKYEFYLQKKKSNFPKDLFDEIRPFTTLMHYKRIERYLHGKAVLIHGEKSIILFMGSANFTKSALLTSAAEGNYEIGLIGIINNDISENILHPSGKKAEIIKKINEIEVTAPSKYEPGVDYIDYITEAVLQNNQITISVNPDITRQKFIPKRIRLLDFNDGRFEDKFPENFTFELTPKIKNVLHGKIAVQIIGTDMENNVSRESNIAWIVELEQKTGDSMHRKMRRIYVDPFALISVLKEIFETGSEEEIRAFLLKFDIPLDLILPPHNRHGHEITRTKGNIEGILPTHHGYIFNAAIINAYTDCLERLCSKLQRHVENPQINKIGNFLMIISSLYALIWFINSEIVYTQYINSKIITPEQWAVIREYYEILFKYTDKGWSIVWSEGGYRDAINNKIKKVRRDERENKIKDFEIHIMEDYKETVDELISIQLGTIEMFGNLKNTLSVRVGYSDPIKPVIFPNDIFLQPLRIQNIKDSIYTIKNRFIKSNNAASSLQSEVIGLLTNEEKN